MLPKEYPIKKKQNRKIYYFKIVMSTRGQKGTLGSLELELEVVVSHLTWILVTELQSFARVGRTLNCWTLNCWTLSLASKLDCFLDMLCDNICVFLLLHSMKWTCQVGITVSNLKWTKLSIRGSCPQVTCLAPRQAMAYHPRNQSLCTVHCRVPW